MFALLVLGQSWPIFALGTARSMPAVIRSAFEFANAW